MDFSDYESIQLLSFLKGTFEIEPLFWDGMVYVPHRFLKVLFEKSDNYWVFQISYKRFPSCTIKSSTLNVMFQERIRVALKKYVKENQIFEFWETWVGDVLAKLENELGFPPKPFMPLYEHLPDSFLKSEEVVRAYAFSEDQEVPVATVVLFRYNEPLVLYKDTTGVSVIQTIHEGLDFNDLTKT